MWRGEETTEAEQKEGSGTGERASEFVARSNVRVPLFLAVSSWSHPPTAEARGNSSRATAKRRL